jgi:glycosyltransferase involved in cell wall biosynthesis
MKKKIFHLSGTTIPGGGPEHVYQLLKRLNPNEWDIVLCTLKDGSYWEKFNSIEIKTYSLALRKISIKTLFNLLFILRKEKPCLIHTHGKGPGLYGRVIGKLLSIDVIHTFHGFHYEDLPILTQKLHLVVESFLSLVTNQHIFVSKGEKNRARVIKFIDEKNSTVIHNGVDYEYIEDLHIKREAVLQSIGYLSWKNNSLIGTISRLSPEKGIINLLLAFHEIIQKKKNLRLIIIGGYPEEHKDYYLMIKRLIEEKELGEHVCILGYRRDALKILKCLDFYVSASLSEGLPISILEALASKIPTIATDIRGNKDILYNSVFGSLVKPNSAISLAEGVIKMTQLSQTEREVMTRNAHNRIKNHFSINEMVNKTTLLYNHILHSKQAHNRH